MTQHGGPSGLGGGRYSPSIEAGKNFMAPAQYELMPPFNQNDFVKIYRNGVYLYRYRYAPFENWRSPIDQTKWEDREYDRFINMVLVFTKQLEEDPNGFVIDIDDDDEEYVYSAFAVALTTLGKSEASYLLEHQFGSFFMIDNIDVDEEVC